MVTLIVWELLSSQQFVGFIVYFFDAIYFAIKFEVSFLEKKCLRDTNFENFIFEVWDLRFRGSRSPYSRLMTFTHKSFDKFVPDLSQNIFYVYSIEKKQSLFCWRLWKKYTSWWDLTLIARNSPTTNQTQKSSLIANLSIKFNIEISEFFH